LGLDVYLTPIPQEEDFPAALSLLPLARHQKFDRYRLMGDKARSLAAGLLLRRFLKVKNDADLSYGPMGQPHLTKPGPYFSLSHSGDFAGLAIGSHPLGLDLENSQAQRDWQRLAKTILTPNERLEMTLWPDPQQFILAAWVLKESLGKATGGGLTWDLLTLEALGKRAGGDPKHSHLALEKLRPSAPHIVPFKPPTPHEPPTPVEPHTPNNLCKYQRIHDPRQILSQDLLSHSGSISYQGRDWLLGHRLALNCHLAICSANWEPIQWWLAENLIKEPTLTPLTTENPFRLAL
jgi:phosphopantetheinyl transferase